MIEQARPLLRQRTLWNINSTATGGGVAEILPNLLAYARGCGIDSRWLVIEGDSAFFVITKRLHNYLHGSLGDNGALDESEHAHYAGVSDRNAQSLATVIKPQDIVVLHDPQTAGLIPAMRRAGAVTVWRCHIGNDVHNGIMEKAWAFLRPYLEEVDAFVFSRAAYVPAWLNGSHVAIIAPSIDAFSVKNQPMSLATARAILTQIGLLRAGSGRTQPVFTRLDGSEARVHRRADVIHSGHLPGPGVPLVVQVSRWDRLKDMVGVMQGFAHCLKDCAGDCEKAHLVLAGPDIRGVTDDPEGNEVLEECIAAWRDLPEAKRGRIHLVCLPMADIDENAAMVNALQRHAAVIVQKSLHEGFGLTVTEAMWKGCPIVASAVGGIQDQIVDGEHGMLLKDPTDLDAFGDALRRLLADRVFARRLGRSARRRAMSHFLVPRHLMQFAELLTALRARLAVPTLEEIAIAGNGEHPSKNGDDGSLPLATES